MSGADVLGRIAHAADVLEAGGMGTVTVADLRGALAAVAELIEALCKIEQAATLGIRYHSTGPGYMEEISRIAKAALSNITGATK